MKNKKTLLAVTLILSLSSVCVFASNYSHATLYTNYKIKQHELTRRCREQFEKARVIVDTEMKNSTFGTLSPAESKYLNSLIIISAKTKKIVYKGVNSASDSDINIEQLVNKTVDAWNLNETQPIFKIGNCHTALAIDKDKNLYILVEIDPKYTIL